jgi:hypothetical protein
MIDQVGTEAQNQYVNKFLIVELQDYFPLIGQIDYILMC